VNTKKTNKQKKPHSTHSLFPCGDFQKMAEMMKNCCSGEEGALDCCSMMREMMERGKGKAHGKTQQTQKPPKGGENG
jgi:hypothetical protein